MKCKRIAALLLVASMVLAAAGCGADNPSKVVAKVGETEITKGQWDGYTALACYAQGYDLSQLEETKELQPYLEYLRNSMLSSLVSATIIEQDCAAKGVDVLGDTYEEDAKEFVENANKEIEQFLTDNKLSDEDLERFYKSQQYLVYLMNETTVSVVDAMEYYENNQQRFTAAEDMVRASHILVSDEALARSIIDKLDNGDSFASLAEEYGTDGTKSVGGDLGPFVYGDMVEDFSAAAFALRVDEYTKEPVKSDFGYHVILCTDQLKSGSVQPYEWVEDTIMTEMQNQSYYDQLDQLRQEYDVEYFVDGMDEVIEDEGNTGGESGEAADGETGGAEE